MQKLTTIKQTTCKMNILFTTSSALWFANAKRFFRFYDLWWHISAYSAIVSKILSFRQLPKGGLCRSLPGVILLCTQHLTQYLSDCHVPMIATYTSHGPPHVKPVPLYFCHSTALLWYRVFINNLFFGTPLIQLLTPLLLLSFSLLDFWQQDLQCEILLFILW